MSKQSEDKTPILAIEMIGSWEYGSSFKNCDYANDVRKTKDDKNKKGFDKKERRYSTSIKKEVNKEVSKWIQYHMDEMNGDIPNILITFKLRD